MVKSKTALISLSLLALFLCIYTVNAYLNYDASMVDDMVIYLKSAHALLHGKMTIDDPVYTLLKSHFPDMGKTLSPFVLNPAGQLVALVSVGITMLLAPFLAVFGESTTWIVRIVWDICIIAGLFFTTRLFFKESARHNAWILAILVIAAYGTVINFRLTLRRDIACAALTTLATLFALLGSQKKRNGYWLAAFGLICLTAAVKITQAMLFLPLALLFVNTAKPSTWSRKPIFVNVIVAAAIAVLIFTPFCIQNHVSSGHWYLPVQRAAPVYANHLIENTMASFTEICKAQAYIYSPKGLPKWCALPFLVIAAIGMWAQRRSVFVKWWVIPFLLLEYGFLVYLFIPGLNYGYTYNIYLAPAYPLSVLLFVCGIYHVIERFKGASVHLWFLTAIFLLPFFAVKIARSFPHAQAAHFRLPQVHQLVGDIEAVIPPKSVVLCDAFLCFPLDYYSDSHFFPPSRLDDSSSSIVEKVSYLLQQNMAVYFCDYRGIEGAYAYQPALAREFSLTLVKKDQGYYNHPNEFPVPPFSIYRITGKRQDKQ
jgi:hypothetical protein